MPLNDIHYELYKIERARWQFAGFSAGNVEASKAIGLRMRLGRVLIASGRALAGSTPAERPIVHNRPASATR